MGGRAEPCMHCCSIRRMWVILLEVQMGVEAHEGAALQQPGEATGELTQVARV